MGDCYFLSTCASIAENDYRIKRLFSYKDPRTSRLVPVENISAEGIYPIQICDRGIWKEIVVDDHIAIDRSGEPISTKNNGAELWMMLLEKVVFMWFWVWNISGKSHSNSNIVFSLINI